MEKIELLAPAQNYDCAISAINSGADAIYIGAPKFGARKNASNSIEDIERIINYAHLFNVKVYITINTILDDDELIECEKLIKKLTELKTDALIIQDFGILKSALDNKIPKIALHASTQCDNRTLAKIKFFENIGLKRVVLARELPLSEIQKIKKNTDIELECFIHGALCVSYSGQCYLSHYIGKRSANRGICAQACRKKYSLVDEKGNYIIKNKYLLSLKDNNLSNHLDKLIKAGVTSFKIEGRLKDENYVKNVVLYYHNLMKKYPRISFGEVLSDFTPDPYKSFNRGFCDDYLFNKKDSIYNFITPKSTGEEVGNVISSAQDSFIIKTNKTINPQDGLCFILNNEFSGCLVNKVQVVKEGVKIYPNKKINLLKGTKIYRNIDVQFNKTLINSNTKRRLKVDFTVYDDKLIIKDERSNKVELNFKSKESARDEKKMKDNFIKALSKYQDSPFKVEKINFEIENMPFLAVSQINELRRKIFDELELKILSRYKVKKQKPVDIAQYPKTTGDYRLNVHNSSAKDFYELCNCKVEERSFESIENHKNKELMRTRHCLKKACLDCSNKKTLYLIDEKGVKYPLVFDCENCEMCVMAPI